MPVELLPRDRPRHQSWGRDISPIRPLPKPLLSVVHRAEPGHAPRSAGWVNRLKRTGAGPTGARPDGAISLTGPGTVARSALVANHQTQRLRPDPPVHPVHHDGKHLTAPRQPELDVMIPRRPGKDTPRRLRLHQVVVTSHHVRLHIRHPCPEVSDQLLRIHIDRHPVSPPD